MINADLSNANELHFHSYVQLRRMGRMGPPVLELRGGPQSTGILAMRLDRLEAMVAEITQRLDALARIELERGVRV
jgi:hypothetical protein